MAIKIKNHGVLRNILRAVYDDDLILLIVWVVARYSNVVFTSGYREEDKGVHGTSPCRGIDIRSRVYEEPQKVADDINTHFIYDPERPEKKCAKYHDTGKGLHIHLQVHPNTTYLGG